MSRSINILFISIFLFYSCNKKEDLRETNITLAAEMSLLPATVWVAQDKGYFKKHNINLIVREFDSGRNALETMLKDDTINISTVAQTPVVFNSFNKEDYSIIATMAYSVDDIKVLARKDHNINAPKDLKGKKIGATMRSTGHYFLEGFLSHYGYSLNDIKLHNVNAAELKGKLESGELDAITSWEPHIYNTMNTIGPDKVNSFISPTPFRKDFFFAAKKMYIKNNTKPIEKFLMALVDAENFIKNNKQESKEIISKRLNVDMDMINRIWDSFTFEITLEQSILLNLENEALWAMKLINKDKIPNYLDFININPLLKVKPEVVNIIH